MRDDRTRRERDLFLRLLEVSHIDDPARALDRILSLAMHVISAEQGYIEVYDDDSHKPKWSFAKGVSDDHLELVQARVSRGIIAEALSQGETLRIRSALLDERYSDFASVKQKQVRAVLCTPVGSSVVRGVLYLEGGSAIFSEIDGELLELLARHTSPLVERLLLGQRAAHPTDPTQEWRAKVSADKIIGRSQALAFVLQRVALVAPIDVSVLLLGASGTGKTCIARAIHDSGPRAAKPFLEINCGAIPESLIESELFGASAGSHSAAHKRQLGKIEAAEGGTLFLDEIAELPLSAQTKLLQLLQSGLYYPLGSAKSQQANLRIVAATNADLEAVVKSGGFREDLYYRINVFPIRVPSLSERKSDIVPLAEHFLEYFSNQKGLPLLTLSAAARVALEIPEWTGNVRELENVVLRGLIYAAGIRSPVIESRHLFLKEVPEHKEEGLSFHSATRRFQRSLLDQMLKELDWNVSAAAERLELTRSHVYGLIKSHGLRRA